MNPRSHLRLVYEANPLSFIAEQVIVADLCLALCDSRECSLHSMPQAACMVVSTAVHSHLVQLLRVKGSPSCLNCTGNSSSCSAPANCIAGLLMSDVVVLNCRQAERGRTERDEYWTYSQRSCIRGCHCFWAALRT